MQSIAEIRCNDLILASYEVEKARWDLERANAVLVEARRRYEKELSRGN